MAEEIFEAIERYGLSKRNRKRTLFSKIGVVGCGKEGSAIATIAALRGIEVTFLEPSHERIDNAFKRIEEKLDKMIHNWGLTENEKKNGSFENPGNNKLQRFFGLRFCD